MEYGGYNTAFPHVWERQEHVETEGWQPDFTLSELHNTLYSRMRNYGWDLYPHREHGELVSNFSTAFFDRVDVSVLTYYRAREQACMIERFMGREHCWSAHDIDIYRHPVIEARLSSQHFAVELVISPDAWWDQQNLIGKLSVERHRWTLREVLAKADDDYRLGFWDGVELCDAHLENWQLLRGDILERWMNTFAEGRDWLRIGKWYDLCDSRLRPERITNEIFGQMKTLYEFYKFIAWSSDNNYRSFYNH